MEDFIPNSGGDLMKVKLPSNVLGKGIPAIRLKASRSGLVLKKNSPHILFAGGVVGFVTTTVVACRATLKLPEVMDEIEKDLHNVKEARRVLTETDSSAEEWAGYTVNELNRDTAIAYLKAGYKLGRLYCPALVVGGLSIGAFSGAHVTLTRRNASLAAAYTAVQKAYEDYRQRVVTEVGPEREGEIKNAVLTYTDEATGEEVKVANNGQWSPYARFFDSACPDWKKDPELNRMFIICQQNYANDRLRWRGHLFLNEVYDSLGMDRTPAGQVVGWVVGGNGDDYVDFGLDQNINEQFMNGIERTPVLDFNVDGVVFELI
jgi:hypothetical protein